MIFYAVSLAVTRSPQSICTTTQTEDAFYSVYPAVDPSQLISNQAFQGKRVIVTGASRGIGEDIAVTFARAGASVVLVARTESQLDAVESRILEHVQMRSLESCSGRDDPAKVEVAVTRAVERFGGVDVLVAVAGTARGITVAFSQTDPYDWWNTLEINLRGVFNVVRYALPHLEHMVASSQ
ncbi:hypothetical protein B0F90DRAFT_1921025 [Multifurca ochricompacta]|uniref:Uncharacterized protein n=1 Tax=Multifurca ochricompacta TaxID=376703 RepID=A0AAD4LUD3_9AGAM|nr:hypothetical protein B0F90DRAFT_1921025 [Multifurca ochricompacta]